MQEMQIANVCGSIEGGLASNDCKDRALLYSPGAMEHRAIQNAKTCYFIICTMYLVLEQNGHGCDTFFL